MSLWRFPNDVSYWFFLSFMRLRRIFSLCFLFTKILRYLIVFSWFNKDFFYLWGLRFTAKDPRLFANSTHVYAIFAKKKKIMYSNFQKILFWKTLNSSSRWISKFNCFEAYIVHLHVFVWEQFLFRYVVHVY